MNKLLITGANSYIGTSFEAYMKQRADEYQVDTVDMIDDEWRNKDFSAYDAVFHVAGIAHSDTGKATEERKALYYKVNTALTIEAAKKAKANGVRQFVFMSSMIVYGDSAPIGKQKLITKDTIPQPANFYGDSKLQAEKGISLLQDDNFNVVILRPPMVYGKGSKGNYPVLAKLALKLPLFPDINNQRSMLYIENLAEFVRLMITNNERGVFCPQNEQYSQTSGMVKLIAAAHKKNIRLIKCMNLFVKFAGHFTGMVSKAFGNLTYELSMSAYKEKYCIFDLNESIIRTEGIVDFTGRP